MLHRLYPISVLALIVVLHSCTDDDRDRWYRVQGVVLVDGLPLKQRGLLVTVTDAPASDPDQLNSIGSPSQTNEAGLFRAESFPGMFGPARVVFSVEICVLEVNDGCITVRGDEIARFEEDFVFDVLDVGTVSLRPSDPG